MVPTRSNEPNPAAADEAVERERHALRGGEPSPQHIDPDNSSPRPASRTAASSALQQILQQHQEATAPDATDKPRPTPSVVTKPGQTTALIDEPVTVNEVAGVVEQLAHRLQDVEADQHTHSPQALTDRPVPAVESLSSVVGELVVSPPPVPPVVNGPITSKELLTARLLAFTSPAFLLWLLPASGTLIAAPVLGLDGHAVGVAELVLTFIEGAVQMAMHLSETDSTSQVLRAAGKLRGGR